MNLAQLAEPFPIEDVEWRISQSGPSRSGVWCKAMAYITARAVQKRLDDVCGIEGWKLEEPRILEINNKSAFAVGISIWVDDMAEWITKWDVCEPTAVRGVDAAKGGFSGAMKRAGAQWGIGRYLYYLDAVYAETSENDPGISGWNYATLHEKHGGGVFYWKNPTLPGWAVPKDPEHEITEGELNDLKKMWMEKFAPTVKTPSDLREGFSRFAQALVGEFPVADYKCWTRDALDKCLVQIKMTEDPNGVSPDVPFE